MKKIKLLIVGLLSSLFMNGQIYVDKDATAGANDGTSWTNAYTEIQDAFAASNNGDEIWVAEGTYYADQQNPGQRAAFFGISTEISIYGGFNGTESNLTDRKWASYTTTLSGKPSLNPSAPQTSYNYRIFAMSSNSNITIDGFTLADTYQSSGGYGNVLSAYNSTGILLTNCIIENHRMDNARGAFQSINNSEVTVSNCLIKNNIGGSGSLVLAETSGSMDFINNTIIDNTSNSSVYYVRSGGTVKFSNTILWNSGTNTYNNGGNVTFDYSISNLTSTSGTNYNQDPLLNSDGTPTAGSIAIDNGDNGFNSSSFDLALNVRVVNTTIDIGAYESNKIIYVDKDATLGNNDGTSWANAYLEIQDALSAAVADDEIWVAEGTYYADQQYPGQRNSFFGVQTGVSLFGGFDGTETNFNDRNWSNHITSLSGKPSQNPSAPQTSYNHRIFAMSSNSNITIDGFTLSDTYQSSGGYGNVLSAYNSTGILLTNCIIENHRMDNARGAFQSVMSSDFTVSNCLIRNNIGGAGSLVLAETSGKVDFLNNTIIDNTSNSTVNYVRSGGIVNFINTILWNSGSNIYNGGGTITYDYSISNLTTTSGTNYNQNPLLDINGIPNSGSIAIDNGDNSSNNSTYDLNTSARIYNSTIDIGAFEVYSTGIKLTSTSCNTSFYNMYKALYYTGYNTSAIEVQMQFEETDTKTQFRKIISPANTGSFIPKDSDNGGIIYNEVYGVSLREKILDANGNPVWTSFGEACPVTMLVPYDTIKKPYCNTTYTSLGDQIEGTRTWEGSGYIFEAVDANGNISTADKPNEFSFSTALAHFSPTLTNGTYDVRMRVKYEDINGVIHTTAPGPSCPITVQLASPRLKSPDITDENKNALFIYPNPSSGDFNVSFEAEKYTQLIVRDVTGRIVQEINLTNEANSMLINLSSEATGVYFVSVIGKDGQENMKITKQ